MPGDVAALQIRLKEAEEDTIRRATEALLPVAQARGVAVLLNDRADLAVALGCDGAHLGQQDGDHAAARKLLGPDRILGITCHDSRHLAMEAGEVGADYVAFGAFFPTTTKAAKHRADPELLAWWPEMFELPSSPSAASPRRIARPWSAPGRISWRWSAPSGTTRTARRPACGR